MTVTGVPLGIPLKSTSTSARSARPISSPRAGSDAGVRMMHLFFFPGLLLPGQTSSPLPGSAVAKPVSMRTTCGNRLCSAPIW